MKALSLNSRSFLSDLNLDYLKIIAVFRISVVLIAIIDFSSVLIDINILISDNSILPWELGLLESDYYVFLKPLYSYLISKDISISFFISAMSVFYIITLVLSGVGFYTRKSIFLALLAQLIIFRSIPNYNYGYDNFITMSLFYCLIFPVGKEFSFDRRRRNTGQKEDEPVYFFSLITFLRTHLSIVYFVSGIAKAVDINWWNGNAIWRSVATLGDFIYLDPFILLIISSLTVLMEMSYPFIAFSGIKKLRRILIIHIIFMHIGIGVILGLSSFASIMIVWNVIAFYEDFVKK